ncbi:MAG: helix-turn-helix domain-containing protein [Clostridioides sp.]|nr:helix-turn-helix domain-containing protein [Clostridioides sp.]
MITINGFLEKEDNYKILMFNYLNYLPTHRASIFDIKESLDLSTFLLNKTYKNLKADIRYYELDDYFDITIENKTISLIKFTDITSGFLVAKYINNSNKYKYLKHCILEDISTTEQFAEKEFLSVTKSYYIRQSIDSYFSDKNISISSDLKLTGSEKDIRYFLYQFHYIYFTGMKYPFENKYRTFLDSFLEDMSPILGDNFTETQRIKLGYFLGFTFLRLKNGHPVKDKVNKKLVESNLSSDIYSYLIKFYRKHVDISTYEYFYEAQLMLIFLYIIDFPIDEGALASLDKTYFDFAEVRNLNFDLVNSVEECFHHDIKKSIPDKLKDEITKIHFKFLYFNHFYFPFYDHRRIQETEESFPDYSRIVNASIANFYKRKSKYSLEMLKNLLFYDFFYAFVSHLPLSVLDRPVHVCVDFSYGTNYNTHIKRKVDSYDYLNLVVDDTLCDETDLYLTDINILNVKCRRLVWTNPPLQDDWQNFVSIVSAIKNNLR